MTGQKPRRQRRSKASIVASIEQAAMTEIAQNGFESSLVTNIIKSAKIEPQVFYNRFKDINEFYDAFVRRYDSYLNMVLDNVDDPIVSRQGVADLLKQILRTINNDPVALELLRWEVSNKNKTTMRSGLLRELNFQPVIQGFLRCFRNSDIDIVSVFAILVGGVYYISLHQKLAPFHGLDLESEESQVRLERTLQYLVDLVFDSRSQNMREAEIAQRLRDSGVNEEVIANALAPTQVVHPSVSVKDRYKTDNES